MNIIVIMIDTLRYDYIGANGNDWIQTPNMDRLAGQSWGFDRAFTASYPTIPYRTDLFTGKYGSPFHVWKPLPHDVPTLPELLGEGGYCTQLIHDTPHLVNGGHNFDWPFHCWTMIRGAEVDRPWVDDSGAWPDNMDDDPLFDVGEESELIKSTQSYLRANRNRKNSEDWNTAKLFNTAGQFLRDNSSRDNFFLWIDCFDPHEPWDVPREMALMYDKTEGYDGRVDPRSFHVRNNPDLSDAAKDRMKAFYAAKVSWVDRWLGLFLDTLDETGLDQRTAILFSGDHGTNVGERGQFGKAYPVREQEGHVPLFIKHPDGGSGRSNVIVQPQDFFATVLAIAGQACPNEYDSNDVLALARSGETGPREIAVSGSAASSWRQSKDGILFTVFDRDYYLELAADPSSSKLSRYGSLENIASSNQALVQRLQDEGITELEKRGADPKLVAWFKSEGREDFPSDCIWFEGYPSPVGYKPYFQRLYDETSGV